MLSYFIKNGSWVFFGNLFLSIFAFITTAILAHQLPKEIFGIYRYILTIIPILAVFTLPDMGSAVTRAVAKNLPLNLKEIVFEKIKFGLIGSGIALVIAMYYFLNNNTELASLFLVTALFIPFFDVFFIYINTLYGLKQFKTASIFNVVSRFITLIFVISVVILTSNIVLVLIAYFLAQIIPQFLFFLYTKKIISEKYQLTDRSTILYGRKLTIVGTLSVLVASMDKLAVWHFFDAETLATYTVALLIAWEGGRLVESIATVILPFLAQDKNKHNIRQLLTKIPMLIFILIAGGVTVALLIPDVFPMVFPAYINSIDLAVLSCFLLILFPLNSILYRYLVAEAYTKKMAVIQITKMFSFSVFFFLTVQSFNEAAALISLICAEIFSLIILLKIIHKDIKIYS